jgi:hypothetical protein
MAFYKPSPISNYLFVRSFDLWIEPCACSPFHGLVDSLISLCAVTTQEQLVVVIRALRDGLALDGYHSMAKVRPLSLLVNQRLLSSSCSVLWSCTENNECSCSHPFCVWKAFGDVQRELSQLKMLQPHPNLLQVYGMMLNPLRLVMEHSPGWLLDVFVNAASYRFFSTTEGTLHLALQLHRIWGGVVPRDAPGVVVPPLCFKVPLSVAFCMLHCLLSALCETAFRVPNRHDRLLRT